jgi:hypothetical protein
MAEPLMTVTVDNAALLKALGVIPDGVMAYLKPASKITADNIQREARSRIKRRTGQTAEAITVVETLTGYIVFVGGRRAHIGRFLEKGTKFMAARPFLFVSARLEQSGHDRRALDAVRAAIAAEGLGD